MKRQIQYIRALSFVLSVSAFAQAPIPALPPTCDAALEHVVAEPDQGGFSAERLAQFNLELKDGNLVDLSVEPPLVLGQMKTVNTKYFFEWADTESQEIWVSRGGILKSEVEESIEAPGQVIGKGYYVSSDLVDSKNFGDAVTVFRPKRPVNILVVAPGSKTHSDFKTNTEFVKRLQKAGIDGFGRLTNPTWYAIISSDILRGASGVNLDVIKNFIGAKPPVDRLETLTNLADKPVVVKQLLKNFPKREVLGKLLNGKELTQAEQKEVLDYLLVKVLIFSRINDSALKSLGAGIYSNIRSSVILPTLQQELGNSTVESLYRALELEQKLMLQFNHASLYSELASQNKSEYTEVLELFDLMDILRMDSGMAAEKVTLDGMKEAAQKWKLAKAHLEQIINPSENDLMDAMEIALGEKPKLRDYAVSMGPNEKSRSYYLETSSAVAQRLQTNGFLSVKVIPSTVNPAEVRVYVEYPSARDFSKFKHFLSPDLVQALEALPADASPDDMAPLNARVVQELFHSVFTPDPNLTALLLKTTDPMYVRGDRRRFLTKALVSIHPLEEGNGRLSRLYFKYMSAPNQPPVERPSDPIFDLDLFGEPDKLSKLYSYWVSQAKNDEDFVWRAKTALKAMADKNPDLYDTFPVLRKLKDPEVPHAAPAADVAVPQMGR